MNTSETNAQVTTPIKTDIAVVGGGPAGLSFACCLANSGLHVTVIDQQSEEAISKPAMDGRDIALNHQSVSVLKRLGVWQRFSEDSVHLLKTATVQSGDSPYALQFDRTDNRNAPLGYLVANHNIRQALHDQVATLENVTLRLNASVVSMNREQTATQILLADGQRIEASLTVAADSRFSQVRRMMGIGARMKDYGRVMLVCNMSHELDHQHTAQECFRYGRTCAILPLGERESSIVITVSADKAFELTECSQAEFERTVESMLDHRLGGMSLISKRFSYPLVGAYADKFVEDGFALIGDAAVGMHPVTAHGYNLGLHSADVLAAEILRAQKQQLPFYDKRALNRYELKHQLQARPLYESTNLIVRLFTNDRPAAKLIRSAALRVSNHLTPFKKLVSYRLTHTSVAK